MNTLTKHLMSGVAAIALLSGPALAESHAQVEAEAEATMDAAGKKLEDVGDATAEAANDAMQATEEAADEAVAETKDAMDATEQTIDEAAAEMNETADEIETDLATETTLSTGMAGYTVADLVGKNVLSDQGNDVGEIDAVVDMNGETMAIVGVGGFLGLGEHDVAIGLDKIDVLDDDTLQLIGFSEEELEAMPEYEADMATELEAEAKLVD